MAISTNIAQQLKTSGPGSHVILCLFYFNALIVKDCSSLFCYLFIDIVFCNQILLCRIHWLMIYCTFSASRWSVSCVSFRWASDCHTLLSGFTYTHIFITKEHIYAHKIYIVNISDLLKRTQIKPRVFIMQKDQAGLTLCFPDYHESSQHWTHWNSCRPEHWLSLLSGNVLRKQHLVL